MGSVSGDGGIYWNHETLAGLSLSDGELDSAVRVQQREVNRRAALYRQGRAFPNLTDRTVIIVDDGLATGATFFFLVATVRRHHPRGVIGAIPVGARSSVEEARRLVDHMIALSMPEPFYAVGDFYRDFEQVKDSEVLRYLRLAEKSPLAQKQPR